MFLIQCIFFVFLFSLLTQVKLNASEVIQEAESIDAFLAYLEPFLVPQSLLQRKAMHAVYPQIGHIFANLPHKELSSTSGVLDQSKNGQSDDDEEEGDSLIINVIEEGNSMVQNLQILNLQPQVCLRDKDASCKPINLYHKVGHGKLDMYVINPARDAKEVREFMERWSSENSKTIGNFKSGINVDGKELWLPLANLVSICALLVWFPDNPDDTITRLLFPGSTPQHKVIRGLDKLKDLEFMQKPVCSSGSYKQKDSKEKMDISKPSYKPASSIPATKKLLRKEQPGKSNDVSLNASKESIDKQESNKRLESVSTRRTMSTSKSEDHKDSKNMEEKESKHKKIKDEKEKIARQDKERKIRHQREKSESRPQRKKVEEKDLKEQRNQAAGALQAKEKVAALTREKPINTSRTKLSETNKTLKPKIDSLERVAKKSTSSASSNKPVIPPPSKTKKEATNKNKKEEVSRSKRDTESKVIRPKVSHSKDSKVSGTKSTLVKGATVAAAAAISASLLAASQGDNATTQDEEVESIVEKHQIEAMETSPIEDFQQVDIQNQYTKEVDDDIEPELERIKDEEDDIQDVRIPDIPAESNINVQEINLDVHENRKVSVPKDLEFADKGKAQAQHVKTPDEVDDLPEHEAVEPDDHHMIDNEEELNEQEVEVEEKIALDLQEKEQIEKQEDEDDKENNSKKSPESDGAEEQREVVEMIISADKIQISPMLEENKVVENGTPFIETNTEEPIEGYKEKIDEEPNGNAEHNDEEASQVEESLDDSYELQIKEMSEKFQSQIENLLVVLRKLEEIFIEESTAVISSDEPDQNVIKAIACKVAKVHEITQECASLKITDDIAHICNLCQDTELLVKRCMKQAIEIIEIEAPGSQNLTKALHMEADLILQCQEVSSAIISIHDSKQVLDTVYNIGTKEYKCEEKEIDQNEQKDELSLQSVQEREPENTQKDTEQAETKDSDETNAEEDKSTKEDLDKESEPAENHVEETKKESNEKQSKDDQNVEQENKEANLDEIQEDVVENIEETKSEKNETRIVDQTLNEEVSEKEKAEEEVEHLEDTVKRESTFDEKETKDEAQEEMCVENESEILETEPIEAKPTDVNAEEDKDEEPMEGEQVELHDEDKHETNDEKQDDTDSAEQLEVEKEECVEEKLESVETTANEEIVSKEVDAKRLKQLKLKMLQKLQAKKMLRMRKPRKKMNKLKNQLEKNQLKIILRSSRMNKN